MSNLVSPTMRCRSEPYSRARRKFEMIVDESGSSWVFCWIFISSGMLRLADRASIQCAVDELRRRAIYPASNYWVLWWYAPQTPCH